MLEALLVWLGREFASLPALTPWLLGIALLVSALGFYRRVYFVSIGYAFSISAMAIIAILSALEQLTWLALLHSLLLAIYGVRLGSYLLRRELRPAYRSALENARPSVQNVSRGQDGLIWLGVSLLYVLMFSPALFHLVTQPALPAPVAFATQLVGLVTMAGGLAIEALADQQKSNFKAQQPGRFCDVGLYRWVRCPNYLGEIIFWSGSWLMGVAFYTSALRWGFALAGLIIIVLIMIGSTKRLEASQRMRYGDQPAYQAYLRSVPVLFPFVPVYSLQNVHVYLE